RSILQGTLPAPRRGRRRVRADPAYRVPDPRSDGSPGQDDEPGDDGESPGRAQNCQAVAAPPGALLFLRRTNLQGDHLACQFRPRLRESEIPYPVTVGLAPSPW